jgi:hypothetical protein
MKAISCLMATSNAALYKAQHGSNHTPLAPIMTAAGNVVAFRAASR